MSGGVGPLRIPPCPNAQGAHENNALRTVNPTMAILVTETPPLMFYYRPLPPVVNGGEHGILPLIQEVMAFKEKGERLFTF
jgi:hypothetical protein